jgi:hypothetical protein
MHEIGHVDRIFFWGGGERAKQLEFLIRGPEETVEQQDFEDLAPEEHLRRIAEWCRAKGYECVSVSLGTSRLNPLPWHVEYVVIPELHPTHLHERMRQVGGVRLQDIPKQFGYTPLKEPHIATPHPFA